MELKAEVDRVPLCAGVVTPPSQQCDADIQSAYPALKFVDLSFMKRRPTADLRIVSKTLQEASRKHQASRVCTDGEAAD